MSTPKRHHFVSQMLLRRFADQSGRLFFFNKEHSVKGVLVATPENLFFEKHLYTTRDRDGKTDVELERSYARLEGRAGPIIEKIVTSVRAGRRPDLTAEERNTWDEFFVNQWTRVPDVRKIVFEQQDLHSRVKEAAAVFKEDDRWMERIEQNSMVDALKRPSPAVLAILRQKGLGIAVIRKPSKSFVIGSMPVVKLAHPGREHLADPTVEVWLPVAHDVAVGTAPIPPGRELVRDIDDSIIRHLNGAIFGQSTVIAGKSERLIASLAHSRNLHRMR